MRMINVAKQPLVGNLSPPHRDRLTPVVSFLREATTIKIGEFSNTWTMPKSLDGKDGAGSLLSQSERNLSVKSQPILAALESTHLNNRNDMVDYMAQNAQEKFLPLSLVRNLFTKYEALKLSESVESASHSTSYNN